MLTMLASCIPNMHGVRKVGPLNTKWATPGAHFVHTPTRHLFRHLKKNRRSYSNFFLRMES